MVAYECHAWAPKTVMDFEEKHMPALPCLPASAAVVWAAGLVCNMFGAKIVSFKEHQTVERAQHQCKVLV